MRRVPGRVNLIGEHTDYNGYPVLPIAIDRDMAVAYRRRNDSTVRISNSEGLYGERMFRLGSVDAMFPRGDWGNYVIAAARELLDEGLIDIDRGMDACFDSGIPVAAGLSSSSALLVAAGLALLAVNDTAADPLYLADVFARAERHAGIEGGGMDQAAALLSARGTALCIDFYPLRARRIQLPASMAIVVSDSLQRAPKTAAMRHAYNLRAVECRLAFALARAAHTEAGARVDGAERLADLDGAGADAETVLAKLAGGPLQLSEIAARTGMGEEDLILSFCTTRDGSVVEAGPDGFRVAERYRHVVREAARVRAAADALQAGEIAAFGDLMNASHESCRDDFGISTAELDTLVAIARANGALGARVTGAGFGGCTVSVTPPQLVPDLLAALRAQYYEPRSDLLAAQGRSIDDALFVVRASEGAGPVELRG